MLNNENYIVLKDKSVLFVDDDDVTAQAMQKMLSSKFDSVYIAKDGKEGLEMFEKYNPDLIVSDIEMPMMNGIVMMEKIKNISPTKPIVIVTGYTDKIKEINLADGVFVKPFSREELFNKFVDILS